MEPIKCPKPVLRNIEDEMPNFERPDLKTRCTWVPGMDKALSPHSIRPYCPRSKLFPSILDVIGDTPVVKLNKIPQSYGIKCEMYVKCEFLNPGGSVKDRIGYRMVLDAEEKGLLKPGYTVIEPTSGNTGIGLALACAVKGFNCIIVMPEKMSNEKVDTLKVLGAKIIRTPNTAGFLSPEGLFAVSQRLRNEIPNSIILGQYHSAGNPLAHYDGTGAEILCQFNNDIDMIVAGAGTGGTVSGIGRKIREECPKCKIVSIDPEGSILARPESLNISDVIFFEMEGIGYDFIPTVLDHNVVDEWYKTNDKDSFNLARRLILEEGLLCGGSSGAVMTAALKAAISLSENQKCVVILPDGIRNYMTKFVSDNWMEARDFKPPVNYHNHWWWDRPVEVLITHPPAHITSTETCQKAVSLMNSAHVEEMPVMDEDDNLLGLVTKEFLVTKIVSSNVKPTSFVTEALWTKFRKVSLNATLGKVSRILEKDTFVAVTQFDSNDPAAPCKKPKERVLAIITRTELLDYITKSEDEA